jgi:hypothetical protein
MGGDATSLFCKSILGNNFCNLHHRDSAKNKKRKREKEWGKRIDERKCRDATKKVHLAAKMASLYT